MKAISNRKGQEGAEEFAVQVEDIHFTYSDGTKALQGISLWVRRGEKIAVMGANGSGKSTFFLTLNGVLRPQSGHININGSPLVYSKKGLLSVRKQVGIVFQDPDNQLFSADVVQEIAFGVLNLGFSQEEVRAKVNKVMAELHITELAAKPTHFLSGGQKKLVALAGILVMEPDIIILDEPVSALDPKHTAIIDEMIDYLTTKGITVILSTHNGQKALEWADRVVLFHQGTLLAEGTPGEIFRNESLLKTTNLEKPEVITLYETLQEGGFISAPCEMPVSTRELIALMKERKRI
ncbi:MAG: ATP-binding cassette domain-containing protein [Anaerovorax sp.]